jgi:hypothetical protein
MATAPATAAHTTAVASVSPLPQPYRTLVVPLAAVKIVADSYAQRAGHGEAVAVEAFMGRHSSVAGEDQEPVVACQGFGGFAVTIVVRAQLQLNLASHRRAGR